MACNPVKFGQIITSCYGLIPSDPSQFMRPYMVSFRMVSVPLDQFKLTTAYMVSNN